jgi:hypothetical protein
MLFTHLMRFIVITSVVFFVAEAEAILTYLMQVFMMTVEIFFNAEAGAHCIDSPYAFPYFNIL